MVGSLDQTMPALFTPSGGGADEIVPLAQLSAGPDGIAVLAKKGEQLLELLQLSFAEDLRTARDAIAPRRQLGRACSASALRHALSAYTLVAARSSPGSFDHEAFHS